MAAAVAVLADMAGATWPAEVPVPGGGQSYRASPMIVDAQLIEVELLPCWFWPYLTAPKCRPKSARVCSMWTSVLPLAKPESRLDLARLPFAQSPLAARAPRHLRASASSTRRTACSAIPPMISPRCCRMRASTSPSHWADELFEHYCDLRAQQGAFDRARIRDRLRNARRPARHQDSRHIRADCRSATASMAISATCRASRAISNAICSIRRWRA